MTGHAALETGAAADALTILGWVAEEGTALALLGPDEPRFWHRFAASAEYLDGAPDPLDRWSARVIGALAEAVGGEALFPFGGPPWQPFIAWAQASGRAWRSPVSLLVHDEAGLWVSYRGAIRLPGPPPPEAPATRPCATCAAPCTTACPVGALTATGYDVAACHAYLDTEAGRDCLEYGCKARRICPAGENRVRVPAQAAFHMSAFHPE